MSLVEETARYLEARSRRIAGFVAEAALLYAGESMRVTTRLMQARAGCSFSARCAKAKCGRRRSGRALSFGIERNLPRRRAKARTSAGHVARSPGSQRALYRRIARLEKAMLGESPQIRPVVQVQFERLQQSSAKRSELAGAPSALHIILEALVEAGKPAARSTRCCCPPVQAGCVLGSMSSVSF